MRIRCIVLLILVLLTLAGCGSSQPIQAETAPQNPKAPPPEVAITNTPENELEFNKTPESVEMPSTPPPSEKFVSLAKKDLADRLQIGMDGINLVKTIEMVWPNAALGCPSPGKVYPPGKVPGYQISLIANSLEYVYNTDWTGQIVLCMEQSPDGSVNPVTTRGPEIGVPIK